MCAWNENNPLYSALNEMSNMYIRNNAYRAVYDDLRLIDQPLDRMLREIRFHKIFHISRNNTQYYEGFFRHTELMYSSLKRINNSRSLLKKCERCNLAKNYKNNILCSVCRINVTKFNLIKNTYNDITKKIPVEIIYYIYDCI
jgi:hypothetical protein